MEEKEFEIGEVQDLIIDEEHPLENDEKQDKEGEE